MQVDTIILLILLFVEVLYLGIVLKQDMQMMQQNSYRNERYISWLKMSGDSLSITRLLAVVMLFMIIGFPYHWSFGISAGISAALFTSAVRKKYKKPVVFTKRVWRLYLSIWFAVAATCAGVAFINVKYIPYVMMALIAFSYVYTLVVNWILKPVEKSINNSFVEDAKKRLAQMQDMKIIGITGSYGKTSTKHYLFRILSEKYNVLMTPGSFNTPMGVVRTVREQMQSYNDVFIVEMGAKNIGDIKEICDIVHPEIGIITAVGPQHLESFKTIENIQKTKFELVDSLPADGFAVVNNDFPYVANRKIDNVAYERYAVSNIKGSSYHAVDIEYSNLGTSFAIVDNKDFRLELNTKLVGECNISNLIGAVLVALHLNVPEDKIRYAVSKIEQVEHRLNMKRTPGGITIIDDAFNSNPDGSRMALDVLSHMKGGKRIVITPGMIELGDDQEKYNKIFGEHIVNSCDIAIVVGKYNRDAILSGLEAGKMPEDRIVVVDSFAEAQLELQKIVTAGDIILYENDLPDTFK